ncbi:putative multidrug resistance protein [Sorghum bicolor]|uniref:MDR-like ABC transporter n=1 Tax=Sorghum bicolor TaxID=4558 RepID=C5XX23_SORBI|nr:putative multidrug resistance protein [Sorghum bicolor]EES06419.2 hypothetical protein SORBI_3004G073400 [Sorghum bicolor]|eukprot:XP_021316184.1 putative multidrug resistance protein [Sorghum bicolor]
MLTTKFALVFKHADAVDVALMVVGLVGAIGDGMSTPVMLAITSRVFDDAGSGPDHLQQFVPKMNENVRYTLYLAAAHGITAFLEGYCWTRTAERQAKRMRLRYLRAVLRQDVEYFDLKTGGSTSSEVITSVSNDSLAVQDVLSEKLPNFLTNVAAFVASYAVAFLLMWRLTLVALPSVLLLIIPGFLYSRVLISLARRIRELHTRPGAIAEQAISSVRTVYSFVAERSTAARFAAALDESVRLGLKQGLAKGVALGTGGIRIAILAFTVWYGSRLVMYHGYRGGTVYNVALIIVFGGGALGTALSNIKYLSEATSAAERIMELIRRVPKIDSESSAGDVLDNVAGEVEFRNVEFCYPSRPKSPIFVNFNLHVPAGRTVALVGESGSGKSTVIALLERFYDPSAGEVTLDGVDIRRLRLKWLRAQMGLVSQEPALFATSIRENILLGKEDATEEEVVAAANAANAHSFISQLPRGYDTQVGERGIQMSGGQKQRIAIARAILKSPKILLLDEATSALDTNSEHVVQEALDLASMGRTTIIIAHRLSTIRNAHLIAFMKSGEVKELGSHDDLIANENGLYSTLVHLQQTRDPTETTEVCETRNAYVMLQSNKQSRGFSTASRSITTRSMGDTKDNGNIENPKLPVPSFKRLLMLNAPEWKQGLLGSFSAIVSGGIQPAFCYIMGSMISIYFSTDHEEIKEKTRTYALISIGLAMLTFMVNIGQHYNFASTGEYLTKRVREQMLAKYLTFEIGWFDQDDNSSSSICSRLTTDANIVRSLVGDRMSLVIHTVSAVLTAYIMGLVIAWRLAILMIAVQPFSIICYYTRYVLLKSMSEKSTQAQAECSKLAAEAVSNLRTISAFSSQNRIMCLFDQAQEGPCKESIRQSWFAGIGLGTSTSLLRCTWALTFWYTGILLDGHHITAKAFFQTFLILISTTLVIADAGSMTADLAKGADAVASVFAILDRETKIDPDNPEGYKPEKLKGEVDIRGVDFAYPSRPDVIIFKRFSLSIQPAKSTALVGQSGSGKSTIIGLIERFYDPTSGVVEIDCKDIKAYNLRSLRQHIGLVSQEPTLFAGTIRENIVYGTEAASEEEIENAARSANAHGFISNLKDGYETRCGEQGVQLSGGQKQRIAIARAILKNPAILLLDEATSALDSQSENVVQEALDRLMVGRTSIVVAHRLSTIQNCNMIVVLEKGVVVETGTHASLMTKGPAGTYFGLVNLQQGGNQVNNAMALQENPSIPDLQPKITTLD